MIKNDVIKIGLIGLGGMANAHRTMISELDQLDIGTLCDVNEELLNTVGDKEGIDQKKRFNDMEALISDGDVDAVISIVPNHLHAKVIELCIKHQKPILAEKPFTLNFEEAEELKMRYEKQPIPCMVGFSYRYTPSFRYARELIQQGKIGRVRHVAVRYLQSFGAPIYEMPFVWRFDKPYTGTGALGDLGAHMIDIARYMIGEFQSVSAMMDTFVHERKSPVSGEMKEVQVDDYASFMAVLDNNIPANFITTRNAIGSGNQHEVTVYGDLGTLHVNCERPYEIDICIIENKEEGASFVTKKVSDKYKRQQLQDFADLVAGAKQEGTPDFYDGYQNQKVLERIIESAESGRMIQID
ncbi:Gfo/Idh/MocA family protein [Pseudalkalibacillus caeni]|uniref:Gfo/Idh/MocA family oxidoreductase n=1 Tax=Exobacillus caeni TaxID=2574798 RepID=A0A5R9EYX7_9BACL|nr:Gfo/Idh/MocA family oxidoreductase [Pseudalkalibacillus caeni]TLS36502.1 Gfo/Idh/MocA family oxidoreductase [Pseudalkalibacillus caeni]